MMTHLEDGDQLQGGDPSRGAESPQHDQHNSKLHHGKALRLPKPLPPNSRLQGQGGLLQEAYEHQIDDPPIVSNGPNN